MESLFDQIAASFPQVTLDEWRRGVEKALKGDSFEKKLLTRTPEGLQLKPLYVRDDLPSSAEHATPGTSFTRGFPAPGTTADVRHGWSRGARVEHPDIRTANALLLDELQGGVQSIELITVLAARRLADGPAEAIAASRRGGVWIRDEADLRSLLGGVYWSMAPVALRAPRDDETTRWLFDSCERLRVGQGGLFAQVDVIEHLLRDDGGDKSFPDSLASFFPVARREVERVATSSSVHDGRTWLISTESLRMAGADIVQEIASALGAFVALGRALEQDGLERDKLLRACEFRLTVDSDFFSEISKLRAFRRCLARVLDILELRHRASDVLLSATTAEHTLTRRDVHVNLLRTTEQAMAAVLGGADSVCVLPFDLRVDGGSAFGHRLARNIQSLLDEESAAGAVADPAGGSFFIERRTEELAQEAWRLFTQWEGAGGFFAVCQSGALQKAIDAQWDARRKNLFSRREPILGVSEFPLPKERAVDNDGFDAASFLERWRSTLAAEAPPASPAPTHRLPIRYLADGFERLRDAADAFTDRSGAPPCVFAAVAGPAASYAARLSWVRNLVAAGGLRLVVGDANRTVEESVELFRDSGAKTALIVSSDELYPERVPVLAAAYHAAGAAGVWLAGQPRDQEGAYRAAGVNEFVFVGSDVHRLLSTLLVELGAQP